MRVNVTRTDCCVFLFTAFNKSALMYHVLDAAFSCLLLTSICITVVVKSSFVAFLVIGKKNQWNDMRNDTFNFRSQRNFVFGIAARISRTSISVLRPKPGTRNVRLIVFK